MRSGQRRCFVEKLRGWALPVAKLVQTTSAYEEMRIANVQTCERQADLSPTFMLWYEDMQRNASAVMAKVLSFLGVPQPNWPLHTPAYVFKVVGVAVDQAISNWQQLARAFNQTWLARYIIASAEVSATARAALEPPPSEGRYRVEARGERARGEASLKARRSPGRSHPSGNTWPAPPVQQLARRQSSGTSARGRGALMQKGYQLLARASKANQKHGARD